MNAIKKETDDTLRKYAAIDIGSNAVRLFIGAFSAKKPEKLKKIKRIRIPLRLGEDVFQNGDISEQKAAELLTAIKAFKELITFYTVKDHLICATAAMREAKNGQQILEKIRKETGLQYEMISGEKEAGLVLMPLADELSEKQNSLLIDIGGGSTDLCLFSKGKIEKTASFKLGAVRLLYGNQDQQTWEELKAWLFINLSGLTSIEIYGTGGNIRKYHKLAGLKSKEKLSIRELEKLHRNFAGLTYEERIKQHRLKKDRADVILTAGDILLFIMRHAQFNDLFVIKTGLAEGIIYMLDKKKKHYD